MQNLINLDSKFINDLYGCNHKITKDISGQLGKTVIIIFSHCIRWHLDGTLK